MPAGHAETLMSVTHLHILLELACHLQVNDDVKDLWCGSPWVDAHNEQGCQSWFNKLQKWQGLNPNQSQANVFFDSRIRLSKRIGIIEQIQWIKSSSATFGRFMFDETFQEQFASSSLLSLLHHLHSGVRWQRLPVFVLSSLSKLELDNCKSSLLIKPIRMDVQGLPKMIKPLAVGTK